ncbi:MAG: hypothetical protein DRP62_07780, partial [Planctomycetota bacterium]
MPKKKEKGRAASNPDTRRIKTLIAAVEEALKAPVIETASLTKIRDGYLALHRDDKPSFFSLLLDRGEVRPEDLIPLTEDAREARKDPALWRNLMVKLRSGVESPRWRLFRQFISLPGGLKFLLDLRADILAAQHQGAPDLEPLDDDLKRLFESWFQNGFLFLKEITL